MPNGRIKIGETLKKLRGKVPRVELATISGVSKQSIQQIEDGVSNNPTMETILALCGALDVNPIEFLRAAYPDIAGPEKIIVKDHDSVPYKTTLELIDGFGRADNLKRACALMLLAPRRGDTLAHFREQGVKIEIETAQRIRAILEGIRTKE